MLKLKVRITGRTSVEDNVKEVEIAVPLKYFSNFCRTLEMLLISSEINLMLPWSANGVITYSTGAETFTIINSEFDVPVVILSIQNNAKLLQQLEWGFKCIIIWYKYLSKQGGFTWQENWQTFIHLFKVY